MFLMIYNKKNFLREPSARCSKYSSGKAGGTEQLRQGLPGNHQAPTLTCCEVLLLPSPRLTIVFDAAGSLQPACEGCVLPGIPAVTFPVHAGAKRATRTPFDL